jgi:hypothetical protein
LQGGGCECKELCEVAADVEGKEADHVAVEAGRALKIAGLHLHKETEPLTKQSELSESIKT